MGGKAKSNNHHMIHLIKRLCTMDVTGGADRAARRPWVLPVIDIEKVEHRKDPIQRQNTAHAP